MGSVFICMKRNFFSFSCFDGLFCDPQLFSQMTWLIISVVIEKLYVKLSFLKSKLYFFGILYSHSNYLLDHLRLCSDAPTTWDYNFNDEIFIWLMISETLVHSSLCHRFWTHGEEEQCRAGRMYGGVVSLMVDQKPKEWVEISTHRTFQGTTPSDLFLSATFHLLKFSKLTKTVQAAWNQAHNAYKPFGGSFTFES